MKLAIPAACAARATAPAPSACTASNVCLPGRENADEIDRGFGPAQRGGERIGIADIGLDGMDLADVAERLQMECEVGTPRGDADAPAVARQRPDDMPADEARAAEYRDDAIGGVEKSVIDRASDFAARPD